MRFLTWGYFVDICYGAKSVTIYMKVYVFEEVSNVMQRASVVGVLERLVELDRFRPNIMRIIYLCVICVFMA